MASPSITQPNSMPQSPPRPQRIDILKNSILAGSRSGWDANAPTPTSPLKINKQTRKSSSEGHPVQRGSSLSGQPVRRTSSSFSHVRKNNLVSNSPWKSPTLGSEDDSSGPIRAKFKPPPASQSGGYKVLPKPNKTPGVTPRKASPSIVVASRRESPSAATRRASLEKKKRLLNNESFKKAILLEAQATGSPIPAGLGLVVPQHELGFSRRQSKGLKHLDEAQYVSNSPFIGGSDRKVSGSTTSSPSLTSSNPSPQPNQQEESEDQEEPATPSTHDEAMEIIVRDPQDEQETLSDDETELPEAITPAVPSPKPSLGVRSMGGRPLPASPHSRRAANLFVPDTPTLATPSLQSAHTPPISNDTPTKGPPAKSSLKSKRRIRGPRSPEDLNHLGRTSSGRRRFGSIRRRFERRKTVTFDERCDVLEFEADEDGDYVDSEWATSEDDEGTGYAYEDVQEADGDRMEHDMGFSDHSPTVDQHHSEVEAINGLVNSLLEDEMSGFHHDPSTERSEDVVEEQSFESRPSLDFAEANTSLDFHEGESFELDLQRATPHFFSRPQSEVDPEEDQDREQEQVQEQYPYNEMEDTPLPPSAPRSDDSHEYHDERSQTDLEALSPETFNGEHPTPLLNGLPAFESNSSLDSRGTLPSSSTESPNARGSPRISKEDVKKRLQMKIGLGKPQREGDTESESEGSPRCLGPQSAFRRELPKTSPTEERPLPQVPPASFTTDMTRQPKSHDPVLQSAPRSSHESPSRPAPVERSITTDGNLPKEVYDMPPSHPGLNRSFDYGQPGVDINDVKSALDRLMLGVENGFMEERPVIPPGSPAHSHRSSMVMPSGTVVEHHAEDHTFEPAASSPGYHVSSNSASPVPSPQSQSPAHRQRAQTEPDVFAATGRTTLDPAPPPPARVERAKSGIKAHEAKIIAKRREARRREGSVHSGTGRLSKRRSLSTGDAEEVRRGRRALLEEAAEKLDVPVEEVDLPLTDSIDRELMKLNGETQPKYRLREHEGTIYASSDDKVINMGQAGDVDSGKAWRAVRRPSDMNEYSRQIRELRNQDRHGKAYGKVFVRVLGIKGVNVPMPGQPTTFTVTLNNGIHCVETPECRLGRECRIDQEFELIEHGQLEFSLTIKVRKDPHIAAEMQANVPPRHVPDPPPPPPGVSKGGFFGFFGGGQSTKKKDFKTHKRAATQPEVVVRRSSHPVPENLAKYLQPDGTLAAAFISFKDVAKRCDTRLFETSYPLMGQQLDDRGSRKGSASVSKKQVGEIVIQLFRLPPLPGVKADSLPQSLEECHRGLRHVAWHKVTYHEGVLTQSGGDCATWRRRHFQVVGASLVAFNDVTNKPIATIELKKAIGVADNQDPSDSPSLARAGDDDDEIYHVERSFRLVFPNNEEISFFTDTDDEKSRWLEILRAMIGRIPPNPLWAELIWQRQEEMLSVPQRSSIPLAVRHLPPS